MVLLEIGTAAIVQQREAHSTKNSLTVIERAYDLEADDTSWLGALLHEIRPFIDQGLGVYTLFYVISADGSTLRVDSPTFFDCPPNFVQAVTAVTDLVQPEQLLTFTHPGPPCYSMSHVFSKAGLNYGQFEPMRELGRLTGVFDALVINCWYEPRRGCCFLAPLGAARRFPARTASALGRVARHVAAAQRLRLAVSHTDNRVSLDAEAVIDPDGRILHAEGEATGKREREVLSTKTRNLVSTQQRFRDSDPEQVASTWNALVDGRWSLVDSFDTDGKRFLLARRNALELAEPNALTPAERQIAALSARGHSTKLVAYELGLSPSAVSGTLQRALRKLRLRSRTELVALFNPK